MASWQQHVMQQRKLHVEEPHDHLLAFDYHLRRGLSSAIRTLNACDELLVDAFGKAAALAAIESNAALERWVDIQCVWPQAGTVQIGHVKGNCAAQAAIIFLGEYMFLLNHYLYLAEFPCTEVDIALQSAFSRTAKLVFTDDHLMTFHRVSLLLDDELAMFSQHETLTMIRALRLRNSGKTWPEVWRFLGRPYESFDTYKQAVKRWYDENHQTLSRIGLTLQHGKLGLARD